MRTPSIVSTFPPNLDLELMAGDANRIEIQLLVSGEPLDLTGATLQAQVRKKASSADFLVAADFLVLDPLTGKVEMVWDGEAVREALNDAEQLLGVWDLQIKFVTEELPTTLAAGRVTLRMDVTR